MKKIKTLILDAMLLFVLYQGVYLGNPNWSNVVMGLIYTATFFVTLGVFIIPDATNPKVGQKSKIFEFYNGLYDLSVFCLFLYCGWFVTAGVWVWIVASSHYIQKHKINDEK